MRYIVERFPGAVKHRALKFFSCLTYVLAVKITCLSEASTVRAKRVVIFATI